MGQIVHVKASTVPPGQGLSCPMGWLAKPAQGPEPLVRKVMPPKSSGTGGSPTPRFSGKMKVKLGAA